jgi:hypothetical protein
MMGFDWLTTRRRRTDSTSARERIEPTLPPIDGLVRIRLRFNDRFAVAVTDSEAALHGISVADAWRDAMGDAPARDVTVEVPVPVFGKPGKSVMKTDRSWFEEPTPPTDARGDAASAADEARGAALDRDGAAAEPTPAPVPAPVRFQPTLSPAEHASRLLAWCRRRGLIGELTIDAVLDAYGKMCREESLQPRPWNPISREFTILVAGRVGLKTYANRGTAKVRVFRVAPAPPPRAMTAEIERVAA